MDEGMLPQGFSGDMIIQILYSTHSQMTQSRPLKHHEYQTIKLKDVSKIPENITKDTYEIYKTLDCAKMRGSVDINPQFWVDVFVTELIKNQDKDTIQIPNGCCVLDSCGIKQYYDLIQKYISELDI